MLNSVPLPPVLPAAGEGEKVVNAWRSGVFATLRRHCRAGSLADDTILTLKPILKLARTIPTLMLFHTVWHFTFSALRDRQLNACAHALETYYFTKIPALEAREHWDMDSWHGNDQWVYSAAWWSGCQRLQPGTACGTQAQESWHRHTLKAFFGTLRLTMPELLIRLAEFCIVRVGQLSASDRRLLDYPSEPWPQRALLDPSKLSSHRRTSAGEFQSAGQQSRWQSEDGTLYIAMRQHTFVWRGDEQPPPSPTS